MKQQGTTIMEKIKESQYPFTTEALIRAMAPIDVVIDSFIQETIQRRQRENEEQENEMAMEVSFDHAWVTADAQSEFSLIVTSIMGDDLNNRNKISCTEESSTSLLHFRPTGRYFRKLITRFVSRLEEISDAKVEDEKLAELVMNYFNSRRGGVFGGSGVNGLDFVDNIPNPRESCYVSFHIDSPQFCGSMHGKAIDDEDNRVNTNASNRSIIGIRVYPHHNDVGVQKVWEAGCCLTEYLMANPHYVANKNVVELGAGTAHLGIAIAGTCRPKSVHLTDYTAACLDNMEHNVIVNFFSTITCSIITIMTTAPRF